MKKAKPHYFKVKIVFFLLLIINIASCINNNASPKGKVLLQFSNDLIIDNKIVDDSIIKNRIFISDTLVVRFRASFHNEKVAIFINETIIKNIDSVNTDNSLSYSDNSLIILPKNIKSANYVFKIRNKLYEIPVKANFRFLDISIDKEGVLTALYNNSILILT